MALAAKNSHYSFSQGLRKSHREKQELEMRIVETTGRKKLGQL